MFYYWLLLLLSTPVGITDAFAPPPSSFSFSKRITTTTSTLQRFVSVTPIPPSVGSASDDDDDNNKSSSSSSSSKLPFQNLMEANMALDVLANKCSHLFQGEPIITRADECQSQWEAMKAAQAQNNNDDDVHHEGQEEIQPDTNSFNIVLKAWHKCCQTLAEYKKHSDSYANLHIETTDNHHVHNNNNNNNNHQESVQLQQQDFINNEHLHPPVYTAKDAAERCSLLLLSQEQEYENGKISKNARPNTQSYNEAIGKY